MSRYIEATYKLFIDNGDGLQLIEKTEADNPLKFYTELGMTIDGFEKNIANYQDGDNYEFTVPQEEAYGAYHPDMIYDLDKDNFIKDGAFDAEHVYQDAILPLQDGNGQRFLARVLSIDDTKVKVDLNHPLAGKDLTFQGTILVNREASDDEIEALKEGQHKHHCCGGHCHHDGEGHCHHDGEGGCGGHCHHDDEGHCNEECEEGCGDGCCCEKL